MRASLASVGIVVCALYAGCGTQPNSNNPASIAVSPNPASTASGPIVLQATVLYSTATPTWTLNGSTCASDCGSLSDSVGFQVTYRPPRPIGTTTSVSVTATVENASVTVPITVATTTADPTLGAGKIAGLSGSAKVVYDAYDIPHISCAALLDCIAIQGYVQAHDRLFPMDFLRRVARGKLAELIGPVGLTQDIQLRTLFTTRAGGRVEKELADNMRANDPKTTAVVNAFISGINAYLTELKSSSTLQLPGEYLQLPFAITANEIAPWTAEDVWAVARLQQFELSESLFAEQDYGKFAAAFCTPAQCGFKGTNADAAKMNAWMHAGPPSGLTPTHTLPVAQPRGQNDGAYTSAGAGIQYASALGDWAGALNQMHADFQPLRDQLKPIEASYGSNNWVISGALSASGKAMVANDPHLSLQYPPLFHLFTMTSSNAADSLDIAGGSFPGVPGALVGRGAHVGWGVTVVGYDVTDIYQEQATSTNCGSPAGCVTFGPKDNVKVVPLIPSPQTFNVRVGSGSQVADAVSVLHCSATSTVCPVDVPSYVLVVPHHGPIVAKPDSKGRTFSVRWTGQEGNTNDIRAFLGLNTAASVDAAMAALNDYSTGAQNFVLADEGGNIGYYPHALVPKRNFADPAKVGPSLQAPWLPLPSDGTAEWGSGSPTDNCAGSALTTPPVITTSGTSTDNGPCWIANADLPQGKNPAKGFFATANADPIGISDYRGDTALVPAPFPDAVLGAAGHGWKNYLSFEWDDSTNYRHARITQVLGGIALAGGKVGLSDMQALQADHVSLIGKQFAAILASPNFDGAANTYPDFNAARVMLTGRNADGTTAATKWSFDCPTGLIGTSPSGAIDPDATRTFDSASCYLFHAFLRTLIHNVFADDVALAGISISPLPAIKALTYMLVFNKDQSFCANTDASGHGDGTTCGVQVVTALITAYDLLTAQKGATSNWRWGRVHTMQPVSQLALVTNGYEPGPYARPGGAFTVDVGNPSIASSAITSFAFGSSGNVRHISVMDAAAPIIKMQLPGPQRDRPTSNLYGPDLLGMWVANTYFDFPYRTSIDPNGVATQSFSAQ
jgi:penicillin G amidase